MRTLISSTTVQILVAWQKDSMSIFPSASRNFTRFKDARLQAVSSRNMYSEQGFDALMRPSWGHVCHSLMVVSYWTPGSAHDQADSEMLSQSCLAGTRLCTSPSVRLISSQSSSLSSASKKEFGTRTLLFAFWPLTV